MDYSLFIVLILIFLLSFYFILVFTNFIKHIIQKMKEKHIMKEFTARYYLAY